MCGLPHELKNKPHKVWDRIADKNTYFLFDPSRDEA